ncbi:hypothetical protein O3P69_017137 [Scylla paramamosain]|uniref:Uncharacterized protein n=1 Tax=Scylla paramamosain TaxID=85552 RepID=A0AAW0TU38_SCYPA
MVACRSPLYLAILPKKIPTTTRHLYVIRLWGQFDYWINEDVTNLPEKLLEKKRNVFEITSAIYRVTSHYGRPRNSHKKYLKSNLTISKLYKSYEEWTSANHPDIEKALSVSSWDGGKEATYGV